MAYRKGWLRTDPITRSAVNSVGSPVSWMAQSRKLSFSSSSRDRGISAVMVRPYRTSSTVSSPMSTESPCSRPRESAISRSSCVSSARDPLSNHMPGQRSSPDSSCQYRRASGRAFSTASSSARRSFQGSGSPVSPGSSASSGSSPSSGAWGSAPSPLQSRMQASRLRSSSSNASSSASVSSGSSANSSSRRSSSRDAA